MKTNLFEGGNIFKNEQGQPATVRINQADVEPTVKWLEGITGLPLIDNMLGTTGKKATSGDLDLAVDQTKTNKAELENTLKAWVEKQGGDAKSWVRKTGISVHFKTPINGDESKGFVQTDFMFGNPEWMKFALQGEIDEKIRGQHRHILLSSIASAQGMKWSPNTGLLDRATNELITDDPNQIAKTLLGQTATAKDVSTFKAVVDYVRKLPKYEELVADARETLAKAGIELPKAGAVESFQPGSIGWMRSLIDIVS